MLSPAHRTVLDAVARRVVPHAFANGRRVDIVPRIEDRLRDTPPEAQRDLERALTALGSRTAGVILSRELTPFTRLSPERQDRVLARWSASPLLTARAVYHGLRRLILAVYYSLPEAWDEIGYLGPYYLRGPAFPWEGPAAPRMPNGMPADDEPIARGVAVRAATAGSVTGVRGTPSSGSTAIPSDARLTADVIVIGSGAGGAVVAARLAEAGRDVVLIEAGSHLAPDELTELEGDMTTRLYADAGTRATDDLSIALLQGAAVGGGTLVNWMITFRAPDFVLDEWEARFGITGLSPALLAPVFERVEREIHATFVPDDAHSPANRLLLEGARRLGWRAGAGRINARGCLRTGFCGQGCRYGAKQSVDRVYVTRAVAAGARLLPDARVERVEIIERDGSATNAARGTRRTSPPLKRVHATRVDRRTRRATGTIVAQAPVVVLAAGAISTPVILQRSGLGGGGVGRYLRLHPTTATLGEYVSDVYAAGGIPQSAVCDEFIRRDDRGYGFWIECAPTHPALAAIAVPGIGEAHRDLMRRARRTTNLISLVRDGSDLDASNGSVTATSRGRRRISYRVGPRDRENLIAGVQAAARILLAAGATNVRTLHTRGEPIRHDRDVVALRDRAWGPHDLTMFSAHVNGTCRLGTDPRSAGVDPSGERFGARGIYVADGSLFPTGLGVNPHLTIMALATVIAERMVGAGTV
ncbi:MAG: hypothetical protein K0S86_476 [Geminicoccaceae bacterium]|nr:hypothetical protein [Geminicoccaceae bacterium]